MSAVGTASAEAPPRIVNLTHLWWVAGALVVTGLVVAYGSLWALNFVHVLTGLLWTGIDLFMGFVIGPVLRRLDLPARKAFTLRLIPRMLFLMPTLAAVTGIAGWYMAQRMGFLGLGWPQKGWVVAALAIIALLTVQGLGILLPTNLKVCFELQKAEPDMARIGFLMRRYVRMTAFQGSLQVAMIVIMARFATGI